jgi:hypothetical protein
LSLVGRAELTASVKGRLLVDVRTTHEAVNSMRSSPAESAHYSVIAKLHVYSTPVRMCGHSLAGSRTSACIEQTLRKGHKKTNNSDSSALCFDICDELNCLAETCAGQGQFCH